jgi:uncharacterized repeat protein (TIGR01451 family)
VVVVSLAVALAPVLGSPAGADVITQPLRTYGVGLSLGVAFSPDGRTVLLSGAALTAVADAATGAQHRVLDGPGPIAVSSDGSKVLTASRDGSAKLWAVATGEVLQTFAEPGVSIVAVALSPDGTTVLTGNWEERAVVLWDAMTGDRIRTVPQSDRSFHIAFSPDGTKFLTAGSSVVFGSPDTTAHLWEVATGEEIGRFTGHGDRVNAVAFSPDGSRVVTGSGDRTAKLWDAETRTVVRTFGHPEAVDSVAFSAEGTRVLTGARDGIARLWNTITGLQMRIFRPEASSPYVAYVDAAISADGTKVITGSSTGAAVVWDAATGAQLWTSGHRGDVISVAFSPDGTKVLTGSYDGVAKLWDARTATELRTFSAHAGSAVAFSPDGTKVLTTSHIGTAVPGTAALWETDGTEPILIFRGHGGGIIAAAFSPDGSRVLTGSWDGTARLWNAVTGEHLVTFTGDRFFVTSVAFSPDGARVLTGGPGAKLWDAATGTELRTLTGHTQQVSSVAFSPAGDTILTGSLDNTAKLWDVSTGGEIRTFSGHTHYVVAVAFSPDGARVVTGSLDETARLWDTATGTEIRTFTVPNGVVAMAFSPDGSRLLTGDGDSTARLWDSHPPIADLSVAKTASAGSVTVGNSLTYVISVTNDGPDAATRVTVYDTLPRQLEHVTSTASAGSCSGARIVVCNVGTLASGASATVTIVTRPSSAGAFTNAVDVVANEPDSNLLDNTATASTTAVCPPCDDGDPCTMDDCPGEGACPIHAPIPGCCATDADCGDGDLCDGLETCKHGRCQQGQALDCRDDNPCTDDGCNPTSGCFAAPNTASCDDRNACTTGDRCRSGACAGGPALGCDDRDPCTDDGCDSAQGCVHTLVPGCFVTTTSTTTSSTSSTSTSSTTTSMTSTTGRPTNTTNTTTTTRPSTTSTTPALSTSTTTLPLREQCGNCVDDDGDGAIDWEDRDCCPQPAPLTITRGRFLTSEGSLEEGKLRLRALLPPVFGKLDPAVDGMTIQLRNPAGQLLCARLDHERWRRVRKRYVFRDNGSGAAAGLTAATLRRLAGGRLDFRALGSRIDLRGYLEPEFTLLVGVGSRCVAGRAPLRTTRKGAIYP